MSVQHNPFRSTAEMVADGTIARPEYLDGGGNPFSDGQPAAWPVVRVSAPVAPAAVASARVETSPAAAAMAKQARSAARKRQGDRVGSLMH
jgi:hypothetical protein